MPSMSRWGMHRPHRTRNERVVVEHAQVAEPHVLGVLAVVEAEVPVRAEPATFGVMEGIAAAKGEHKSGLWRRRAEVAMRSRLHPFAGQGRERICGSRRHPPGAPADAIFVIGRGFTNR